MNPAVFLLAAALSVTSALHWSPALQNNQVLYVCSGQDVDFPWRYTKASGDVITAVKWIFDGRSQEMVAVLVDGSFLPLPAFSNRVQSAQDAGLKLSHATAGDSGNFSVEISGHDTSGSSFTLRHTFVLEVEDDLVTTDHLLHVTQEPVAMYSNSTDQWHAVLTCGHFTYSGDPPISVEWQIPSSDAELSTAYKDGNFYLMLPNPVTDGSSYTCRIPRQQLPDSCLHGNGGEATLVVDGVTARLTVMEARQSALQDKNQQLENHVTSLQSDNGILQNQVQALQTDNDILQNQVKALQTNNGQLNNQVTALQHQVTSLQEKANLTAAFSAKHPSPYILGSGHTLVLTKVQTNIGGGYNPSTGIFTIPYAGIYFFVGTATPSSPNRKAYIKLVVDGTPVSYSYAYLEDQQFQSGSCQFIQRLQRGQRVWLEAADSDFLWQDMTYFTGFLVTPDP